MIGKESKSLLKWMSGNINVLRVVRYLFFANCGGENRNKNLFAGNLLIEKLYDRDCEKIANALIFRNQTRKTTHAGRNVPILKEVIANKSISFSKPISVLDIGSSFGLDSLSNYEVLRNKYEIDSYVLGDLYTEILYDQKRGLIFDQDGNLLQVLRKKGFVSINFEFKYPYQKFSNFHKFYLPKKLKEQYVFNKNTVISIKLIHPKLRSKKLASIFTLKRVDIFSDIKEKYDLILCFHLLTERYFTKEQINNAKEKI